MYDSTGIWFQRQDDLRATVALVNDQYRYTIRDAITHQILHEGTRATLPLAKRAVFDLFEAERHAH